MLHSNEAVEGCGREADFRVFETEVRFPANAETSGKVLVLTARGMDEGLEVRVDGRVVGYRDSTSQSRAVPLLTDAGPGDVHTIRVTHLNDCRDARPLDVELSLQSKSDAFEGEVDGDLVNSGACGAAPGSAAGAGTTMLLGLALLLRRRRR
jgi:uncharacterized protein (TIGR03382 family)